MALPMRFPRNISVEAGTLLSNDPMLKAILHREQPTLPSLRVIVMKPYGPSWAGLK
jgi:hypothetical protein